MTRTVKLEITSDVKGLQNGLRTAQRATSDFARDVQKFGKRNAEDLRTLGDSAGKAGLAVSAGFALVGKAAIDWESAFAGVRKTVDATEGQYAQLEDGLRSLAKTLPATHTEIAGVAEAAGQLGVARKDIVGFTKTMIDLGESTNLTAEDAATNIAQISNVMGTMGREGALGVQRFGSALVALGNDGASTEAEILAMAQRIAGAGATLGATESDVLALSNTLASMGVNAELGGGVASRVLLRMRTAVDESGESLESFAKVAGLSAEEFSTKFREAPVEALNLVAQGIHGVNEAGGNVTATLKEMGIKGTEETQVMLALANSGDLLTDSLELGSQAWRENTALVAEAEQRYNTTEAKISIAWNKIKDAAITAGGVILPMIGNIADAVGGLADWFGSLPSSIQTFLTVLGGVGGTAALGLAGVTMMATKLGELSAAMSAVYGTGGRAHTAIKNVGKALTGITAVGAGLLIGKEVIEGINDAARRGKPDLEAYFNLIATGGDIKGALNLDEGDGWSGTIFKDSAQAAKEYYNTITVEAGNAKRAIEMLDITDGLTGLAGWFSKNLSTADVRGATEDALQLQEAMKGVARALDMGAADQGIGALSDIASQLELTDQEVSTLINSVPELKSALTSLATDGGIQLDPNDELGLVDLALGRIKVSAPEAAAGAGELEGALDGVGAEAEETAASLDDILASLFELGVLTRDVRASEADFEAAIDGVTDSIEQNGKSLDITTEKGRANQAALDGLASSGQAYTESLAQSGASEKELQASMQGTYDSLITAAGQFGITGDKATALAREIMGVPDGVSVDSWMSDSAKQIADGTAEAIDAIPGYTKVSIAVSEDGTVGQVQSRINEVTGKTEYVFVTDDGTVQNVQAGIANIDGKDVPVYVGDDGTVYSTQGKINGIKGKDVTIVADAATGAAEAALNNAARDRVSVIRQRVVNGGSQESTGRGGRGGLTRASGGAVFGPGTETSDSIPAWLSTNEHVLSAREVRGLGGHDSVERLRAMARNGQAPGFATGGAVGRAEKRVKDLQKSYSAIDSKKANRARKQAAKDQLDAAKEELKAAKSQAKLSADAAKDARERANRLSESRRDLRVDLRRGSIVDSFTSGSGLSQVDKLLEVSRSTDYSMSKRKRAAKDAYGLEKALVSLTKRSEGLEKALEAAKDKADELRSVRDAVANDLRGEFSLSGMLSDTRQDLGSNPFTAKSISSKANKMARRIEVFAGRLNRLRKLGYGETIIQEIAALGTEDGILAAGALMNASKQERNNIIGAYGRLDRASGKAGQYVTESMYKGGLDAADGLVRGLESKNKNVENAFYKLGKNAEKSFKRSLGIKSPSRVMMAAGVNVGEGAELGILSKVGDVQSAAEQLMSPPALMVPPSVEVSRYASTQQASALSPEAIVQAVQAGMSGWQPMVQIDGRKFYGAMVNAEQQYGKRR